MGNIRDIQTDTNYNITLSPDGYLDSSFISGDINDNDIDSTSEFHDVDIISNQTDFHNDNLPITNSTVFNRITTMLGNIRYIYYRLGIISPTELNPSVTNETLNINPNLSNVPAHTHTVSDLPTSNIQTNSSQYIPTSALIHQMNEQFSEIVQNSLSLGQSITTGSSAIGGIQPRTAFESNSNIINIIKQMLYRDFNSYEYKSIGDWQTSDDCAAFFGEHTPENGWAGLKLGNYVRIRDGTHNTYWMIAGFNCELTRTAATGQSYNNGYGLMMIPCTTSLEWGATWNTTRSLSGGYASSNINTLCTNVYNCVKTICSHHIKSRRVYLSNSVDTKNHPNSITSTTRYLTCVTNMQVGTNVSNSDYNTGEANYKLSVFDYRSRNLSARPYWTRNICTSYDNTDNQWCCVIPSSEYSSPNNVRFLTCTSTYASDTIDGESVSRQLGIRPIMYLR